MQAFIRRGKVIAVVVAAGLSLIVARTALADAAGAQKYVDEAKALLESRDYEGVLKKLELAEAELEGVEAGAKAPVQAGIDAVKNQVAGVQAAGDKQKYTRDLERVLGDAEGAIGNLVVWPGAAARFNELANNPAAKAALGDELTKAQSKFATFEKLHNKKASAELGTQLDDAMKEFEADWTENKPKLTGDNESEASNAYRRMEGSIAGINRRLANMAADDAKAVAAKARLAAVQKEMGDASAGADAAKVAMQLTRALELYADNFKGWTEEGTPPTWDEYKSMVSEKMSAFNAPKSIEVYHRLTSILNDVQKQDDYKTYANAPIVKTQVDKITAMRDAAYAKVLKNANAVVAGAEAAGVDQKNSESYGRLEGGVRFALGDSREAAATIARAEALGKKFQDQLQGNAKANEEAANKLTAEAEKAWPGMVAKFDAKDGMDPGSLKSGTYYRIKDGANRMGWDFSPESGGFPFAMKVNGQPIAGTYDPAVKAAIDDVQKKIGSDIEDRGWDFVVLYEGKQGKLQQKREGDVKTTGGEKIGTITGAVSVDAPIVKVVALHVGPLAVAAGQGAVTESGAVAAPVAAGGASSGATGGGGSGFFSRFLFLLIGLAAAFVCLVKARFAPLTSVPQIGQVQTSVGDKNLAYVSLVCAVFGLFWLMRSMMAGAPISVLVSLSVAAAGLYGGLEVLKNFGAVKPDLEAKIKPLGVPIGLACVVLVLLGLVIR